MFTIGRHSENLGFGRKKNNPEKPFLLVFCDFQTFVGYGRDGR